MDNGNDNDIKRKVYFYKQENQFVHIKLNSDRFYNGIISEITDNDFVIEDRIMGRVLVIYSEVVKIEPFEKDNRKGVEK